MTPEQQRITIAEACGWKKTTQDVIGFTGDVYAERGWLSPLGIYQRASLNVPPDYLNDLNAMHEAEKSLNSSQQQQYLDQLDEHGVPLMGVGEINNTSEFWLVHATAAQRAEAFLRTIGKWID